MFSSSPNREIKFRASFPPRPSPVYRRGAACEGNQNPPEDTLIRCPICFAHFGALAPFQPFPSSVTSPSSFGDPVWRDEQFDFLSNSPSIHSPLKCTFFLDRIAGHNCSRIRCLIRFHLLGTRLTALWRVQSGFLSRFLQRVTAESQFPFA